MDKKLVIYTSGDRYVMDGMSLSVHGGIVQKEVDLKSATPDELASLRQNPQNDTLLAEIEKRV